MNGHGSYYALQLQRIQSIDKVLLKRFSEMSTKDHIETNAERLQNVLARCGVASRRHAAEMIAAGRVTVNGAIETAPGFRVRDSVQICVDGQPLSSESIETVTILMYKPRGVICSADNAQGTTVCDLVKHLGTRLVPAGRLDKASEGAIIISNDGNLINHLTHPRYGHKKRYVVTVTGKLTDAAIEALKARQMLEGYLTLPAEVKILERGQSTHKIELTLREGRHHQVKRLCGRAGLFVTHLLRSEVAGLTLQGLHPGEWRILEPEECARLCTRVMP